MDMPLDSIKRIMGRRDFDVLRALEKHRDELDKKIVQMQRLRRTVDDTIQHIRGEKEMSEKQFFQGFSEEQQAEYEKEARAKYGDESVQASVDKWNSYSPTKKKEIMDEGNALYSVIVAAIPKGAASAEAQAGVERWRRHMEYFWEPNDEQLLGLVEMYNDDPRFKATYDRMDPRLAGFMREAVREYVKRRGG
jgi:hypothetical protein